MSMPNIILRFIVIVAILDSAKQSEIYCCMSPYVDKVAKQGFISPINYLQCVLSVGNVWFTLAMQFDYCYVTFNH